MKISGREVIIAAVAILVLLGIGYFINNNNSDSNSEDQNQEDQVNLEEENSEENDEESSEEKPEGVSATEPEADKEIKLADVPNVIVVRTTKELAGGSEIKVVSDQNQDVVTARNRISADLKTLTAPINVTQPGVYTVTYDINWADGTTSTGRYTVRVTE